MFIIYMVFKSLGGDLLSYSDWVYFRETLANPYMYTPSDKSQIFSEQESLGVIMVSWILHNKLSYHKGWSQLIGEMWASFKFVELNDFSLVMLQYF